uniref:Centrosomal protein POC5 n=1 Tax=Erpetoichthys calabaricus TaxID=27687 RepID=A0A8C4T5T3_ERPCA
MSSDEQESVSPLLPKDSDHGSSVSSDLQDEYEELLRYAVVTPKFEPAVLRQSLDASLPMANERIAGLIEDVPIQHSAVEEMPLRIPTECNQETASGSQSLHQSTKTPSSPRVLTASPDLPSTVINDMSVSEDNIHILESVLDNWSCKLKTHVLMEVMKWKQSIHEQYKLELRKEKERNAAHEAQLANEADNLKQLLHSYETSLLRKDEVISHLMSGLEKQRKKLELMRRFSHWRIQQSRAREEAYANNLADRYRRLVQLKKPWMAWQTVLEEKWKDRVERACQARAEEVCLQLSTDYEGRIVELSDTLEKARREIQRLHSERERYEESMKRAFMRGVCALNMEALSMFNGRESRAEHEHPSRREEPCSSQSVHFHLQGAPTATPFSPVHFESSTTPTAAPSEAEEMFSSHVGPSSVLPRSSEGVSSTLFTRGSAPAPTSASAQALPPTRIVTSAKQKAGKTIRARITGRSDHGPKASRVAANLRPGTTAPSMSSVIVERHLPSNQPTVAKAPAAPLPQTAAASGKAFGHGGRTQNSSANVQAIKLVE